MFRHDESGYSIVEVMVAILILMAAILPMFKMFDVSLQTAMRSSDYDRARALAEKQTEIAQSVDADYLRDIFPNCNGVPNPITEVGVYVDDCKDSSYSNLRFSVEKTPSTLSPNTPGDEITIQEHTTSGTDPQLTKIVIEVSQADGTFLFRTVGVIANEDGDG